MISPMDAMRDARWVLAVLTDHSARDKSCTTDLALHPRMAVCSVRFIHDATGLTQYRVRKALFLLEQAGYIGPAHYTRSSRRTICIRRLLFPYPLCTISTSSETPVN